MTKKTPLVALTDILDAIGRIEKYTVGKDAQSIEGDDRTRDAVERCIEIISEASRRIPPELKARHADIPWSRIAGIGNIFRHEYDQIDLGIVWALIAHDLPSLKQAVAALIKMAEKDQR